MLNAINQLDLAFVVDTTGSMSELIAAAQRQMIMMINEISHAAAVDLHLAIVAYRDHPPQDKLVTQVYQFSANTSAVQANIQKLKADGGGDQPEAVLDGVVAACRDLAWRSHARRIAVLFGDAPPHGVGLGGDAFPTGCPCGETIESVAAVAEQARVTLYAVGLNTSVTESFTRLSRLTGGEYFTASANAALERLKHILGDEFGNLEVDRRVLDVWKSSDLPTIADLAEQLATTRNIVAQSISRLDRRDLLT